MNGSTIIIRNNFNRISNLPTKKKYNMQIYREQ